MSTVIEKTLALPSALGELLDDPGTVFQRDRGPLDIIEPEVVDRFRLEAARRYVRRGVATIPAVAEQAGNADVEAITDFNDLLPFLFEEDAYKTYDPAWLETDDYVSMTSWVAGFTSRDYSDVKMDGCKSVSEWCERIRDQTGDLICHSSGTSGTLSFVPRSQHDQESFAHALMWNFQSQEPGGVRLFFAGQPNDVTLFSPNPRWMFRITTGIYDGLEHVYQTPPVEAFMITQAPEYSIVQGRIRTALARGKEAELATDALVAEWRGAVEQGQAEMPGRLREWTTCLIEKFQGRRIIFQGSFDMAWNLALEMRDRGIRGAFAPDSIFSVIGGVKDGTVLPDDWQDQFRDYVGVSPDAFSMGWGMSETNCGLRQCSAGKLHFGPHVVPFLLEPGTRNPLPRKGVQRGQLAMLEMVSRDNWGGMVSGDAATIDWDSKCACGRHGPLMESGDIRRV